LFVLSVRERIVIIGAVVRARPVTGDGSGRSLERLREHWEIERELANRLRNADREQRSTLYGRVYDELFRRVPDHPQVVRKADPAVQAAQIRDQQSLIRRFLAPGGTLLEVGAGDGALALAMTTYAGQVYAVEVSQEIADTERGPANLGWLITDGRQIPVRPGTVDLVYSNQLMEHLHPDDAAEQLHNIFTVLRPGGRYLCMTPNRLLGPSDISQYFEDEVASGFHLREYSGRELRDICYSVGFASIQTLASLRGWSWAAPMAPFAAAETLFEALPRAARMRLKASKPVRKLLSPAGGVIATKR
jgi:SAM-dependent methyltransferase